MKVPVLHLLFCSILFFYICALSAQSKDSYPKFSAPAITHVSNYGIGEGLPQNCIEKAVKDSKGRIWITLCENLKTNRRDGFTQYDGKQTFFYPIKIENSQDSLKWAVKGATEFGFLYSIDQTKSKVLLWHPDTKQHYFFPFAEGEKIKNIIPDSTGSLLTFIQELDFYRVYRLSPDKKQLLGEIQLDSSNYGDFAYPHPSVLSKNNVWFLNKCSGIVNFNLSNGKAIYYPWEKLANNEFNEDYCDQFQGYIDWQIEPLDDQRILIYSGRYNGFWIFDVPTLKLSPYKQLNDIIFSLKATAGVYVNLFSDNNKNILVNFSGYSEPKLSFDGHENVYDLSILLDKEGEIYNYDEILHAMKAIVPYENLDNQAGDFFSTDFRKHVSWSSFGGLILSDLQLQLDIQTYLAPYGGRAMVAVDDSSLIVNMDLGTMLLTFPSQSSTPTPTSIALPHRPPTFSNFYLREHQKMWMVGGNKDLVNFDLGVQEIERLQVDVAFDKFLFLNDYTILLIAKNGQFFLYDLKAKQKKPFQINGEPASINGLTNDFIYNSKDSILWLAAENGLWRVDIVNHQLLRFGVEDGFPDQHILSINQSKDGRLWLGTFSDGVIIFDPSTKALQHVNNLNGLSNNTVPSILSDKDEYQWVATYDGISVLSPEGKVVFRIYKQNGLADNEFNRTSSKIMPNGDLVFGGVNGFSKLDPIQIRKVFEDLESLNITLNGLTYFDKSSEQPIQKLGSIQDKAVITIPAANRFLTLDFSMSEYINLESHTYAYRIIPQYNNAQTEKIPWMNIGSNSSLLLNNLPVGNHIVQVKGVDHKGNQTVNSLEVPIYVEQFFYLTWWFYLLCVLAIGLGISYWIRRIFMDRERLKIEVEKRTHQILKDKEIIEQQAEDLKQLDETKSIFFANISHEFRTPLTIISGMTDQIYKNPAKWLEQGTKMIQRNNTNLLDLVNQILDLQKLEAGRLKTNLELGDVIPLLRSIIEQFQAFSHSKLQRLKFKSLVETVIMDHDPEKILRIVSNLISNAIKYTPERGIVSVVISTGNIPKLQPSTCLILSVTDTGQGIPSDQLSLIFDRFHQATIDQQGNGVGTGIGLSLTKELVKLLNGKIEVSSEVGKGTSFQVYLPITQSALPSEKKESISVSSLVFGTNGLPVKNKEERKEKQELPIVLVVEDNSDIAQYLQICLEGDYQVEVATNGQAGIDQAISNIPDIIISDVMMPEKNGFELCEALKDDTRTSHIPIILLTAKTDVDSRIAGLKQGADDYLAKPFHEEELLVRMKNLLEIRRELQKRYQNLSELSEANEQSSQANKEDAFILKLKEIFEKQVDNPDFGLDELSKALFLSRSQLGRKVKALTGKSPAILLRTIRLKKARHLLLHSELNVNEVALEVGFNNRVYFSRTYSNEFGESPVKTLESRNLRN